LSLSDVLLNTIVRAKDGIAKAKADGSLTPQEVWEVAYDSLYGAIQTYIVEVAKFVDATGAEKKEQVIQACEKFYEEVLAPLDIPGVPNWFVEPAVDRAVGAMIRPAVSGLIERFYQFLRPRLIAEQVEAL